MVVNSSHRMTSASTAQMKIERSGLPGKPTPPPPSPNRARLRLRKSSNEATLPGGGVVERRPRLGGSPHGPPPPPPSDDGGSSPSPPVGPHGPLLSANRPRARAPSPQRMLMRPL